MGFILPVIAAGSYLTLTDVERKKRMMVYFVAEGAVCLFITMLTLIIWIRGHSRLSIISILAKDKAIEQANQDSMMRATLLTQQLLKNDDEADAQNDSIHVNSVFSNANVRKLSTKTGLDELNTRLSYLGRNKSDVHRFGSYHENDQSVSHEDNEAPKKQGLDEETERKLAVEKLKKHNSIFFHIGHLFQRSTLVLLMINYGLSFGTLTAQGAVAAQINSFFGISQVSPIQPNPSSTQPYSTPFRS